jgi:hypothetical protein
VKRIALLTAVGLLLASAGVMTAQDKGPSKEDIQKAEGLVKDYLAKIKGEGGQIVYLGNAELDRSFPKHRFFAVRYRIYPVAKKLPEGMKPSNVFVVPPNGRAEHIKDAKALENYFKTNLPEVKQNLDATFALLSWLTLTQEFHQDGFYKFKLPTMTDGKSGNGIDIKAAAVVMQGGNGELAAEMSFDKAGKLTKVVEDAKIKRGPRPICQATKLLDADPLVRRICEQDLLYMGRPALDYLREQRALAGPELRQAIDRVIDRIQQEKNW